MKSTTLMIFSKGFEGRVRGSADTVKFGGDVRNCTGFYDAHIDTIIFVLCLNKKCIYHLHVGPFRQFPI